MKTALIGLAVAFMIDLLMGDPPNHYHPVAAMGSLIHRASARLNKGPVKRRFLMGMATVVLGGCLFSLPLLLLMSLTARLPFWATGVLVGCLLKPVISFRNLFKAGNEVQVCLISNQLAEARHLVAWHLVSRDTSHLSGSQVASAAIESLAENMTDSFFAPLFYFCIGGLPAAWFYRFVNTADSIIAYHLPELEHFGKMTAWLDDLLNWLPARLAGLILVVSAGILRMNMINAWKTMWLQNRRTSSPNAGWTMSAAAGALDVVLEKPDNYRLEGGSQLPDETSLSRSFRLVKLGLVLCFLFCGGTLLVIYTIV